MLLQNAIQNCFDVFFYLNLFSTILTPANLFASFLLENIKNIKNITINTEIFRI